LVTFSHHDKGGPEQGVRIAVNEIAILVIAPLFDEIAPGLGQRRLLQSVQVARDQAMGGKGDDAIFCQVQVFDRGFVGLLLQVNVVVSDMQFLKHVIAAYFVVDA
jgi:hypothetical protein